MITLIPKIQEANTIRHYRPIYLLNVDYKIFTKVLTNRLVPVANKVIRRNQTGFIKGRNILEGVVILHEVLHELRRSKSKGLVLKIDFEKAYNRGKVVLLGAGDDWKGISQGVDLLGNEYCKRGASLCEH